MVFKVRGPESPSTLSLSIGADAEKVYFLLMFDWFPCCGQEKKKKQEKIVEVLDFRLFFTQEKKQSSLEIFFLISKVN